MRKLLFGSVCMLALGLTACGGNGAATSEETSADTVSRRFVGTTPAADCPGIVWDLTLRNPAADSLGGDFALSMTYLEADNGKDMTFSSAGEWSVQQGIAGDPMAVRYQLVEPGPQGPDTSDYLFLGDSVVMLDADMARIPNGLNYTLTKVK